MSKRAEAHEWLDRAIESRNYLVCVFSVRRNRETKKFDLVFDRTIMDHFPVEDHLKCIQMLQAYLSERWERLRAEGKTGIAAVLNRLIVPPGVH